MGANNYIKNYLAKQDIVSKLKFIYSMEFNKQYTIPVKKYESWDKVITDTMIDAFFRFDWILKLTQGNVAIVAKTFNIAIPDHYAYKNKFQTEMAVGKMFPPDKRRHLHRNLDKFILSFNEDNTKFYKIKLFTNEI